MTTIPPGAPARTDGGVLGRRDDDVADPEHSDDPVDQVDLAAPHLEVHVRADPAGDEVEHSVELDQSATDVVEAVM
jgi:hypothetical protein